MEFFYMMELAIITIPICLYILLLCRFLFELRSSLPWRVNCWFCNSNIWVKYIVRNCWTCPKCEQYNGFTKDGDYNKVLCIDNEKVYIYPKTFKRSPPKNGLCRMCNINQQLKVTQLANFIPMDKNKYDEEIDSYRTQLDKAYKLCSPCKRVLQIKLHREKEILLHTKILETRATYRGDCKAEKQTELCNIQTTIKNTIKNVTNAISRIIALILLVLVAIECLGHVLQHIHLLYTNTKLFEIIWSICERVYSIVKMKTLYTFPSLADQLNYIFNIDTDTFTSFNSELNDLIQKSLVGVICFTQIIGHFWNIYGARYFILLDLLWSIFVLIPIVREYVTIDQIIISLIKLFTTLAVLLVYSNLKNKIVKYVTGETITPKKFNNFANTCSLVSGSLMNGRSFTPRNDSLWSKPKANSCFCGNSATSSPKSYPESVFNKSTFNKNLNLANDDSDSDLDESISILSISSEKKECTKTNPVFALRNLTASPNFVVPTPVSSPRPLISPSKLGNSTSWASSGYWGFKESQLLCNMNQSRTSSQSSGFESQPQSREESMFGKLDKFSIFDRFQTCNMNSYSNQNTPMFRPVSSSSPVFSQTQFQSPIPQLRLAQQTFVAQDRISNRQFSPNQYY